MWWEPASVPLGAHEQRAPIVFRIRIGRMTGRRVAPDAVNAVPVPEDSAAARRPSSLTQVLRHMVGRH